MTCGTATSCACSKRPLDWLALSQALRNGLMKRRHLGDSNCSGLRHGISQLREAGSWHRTVPVDQGRGAVPAAMLLRWAMHSRSVRIECDTVYTMHFSQVLSCTLPSTSFKGGTLHAALRLASSQAQANGPVIIYQVLSSVSLNKLLQGPDRSLSAASGHQTSLHSCIVWQPLPLRQTVGHESSCYSPAAYCNSGCVQP